MSASCGLQTACNDVCVLKVFTVDFGLLWTNQCTIVSFVVLQAIHTACKLKGDNLEWRVIQNSLAGQQQCQPQPTSSQYYCLYRLGVWQWQVWLNSFTATKVTDPVPNYPLNLVQWSHITNLRVLLIISEIHYNQLKYHYDSRTCTGPHETIHCYSNRNSL